MQNWGGVDKTAPLIPHSAEQPKFLRYSTARKFSTRLLIRQ